MQYKFSGFVGRDFSIALIGSLSKDNIGDSENVIWKFNFMFLLSFLNYSESFGWQNVF